MEHYLNIAIRSIFLENMALAFFLGMCSFLACSKKVETALGLGVAVVFVQALTVPLNNLILNHLLKEGALGWLSPALAKADLTFLAFILFIGTIAATVQVVEMAVEKFAPALYTTLGQTSFEEVKKALEEAGFKYNYAEVTMVPQSTVRLSGREAEQMLKLMEGLEDSDDVQKVYGNFDIAEEEMERLSA